MISYLPYIFVGGGIGATLRFLLSSIVIKYFNIIWLGTFIVNALGCLLIFLFYRFYSEAPKELNLLLTTGVLGGLTTFSTFSYEVVLLSKNGHNLEALGVVFLNISVGVILGIFIMKRGGI